MAQHVVAYFAYGADLDAATWGVPMEVALLRYHRLVLVRPDRNAEPELSLARDPEGEVPGLVFWLSFTELGRAMNLGALSWARRLERVMVTVPGDRVFSVVTTFVDVAAPSGTVSRECAARLRALYQDHGLNSFALEGALARESESLAERGMR